MDERIRKAFDGIQTPERLKRKAKAYLRKKTFDYGRNLLRIRRFRSRIAAGVLMLSAVLTGAGIWFFPTTSIGMDVNPSVELKVNALDRVISLKGRNSDGMALAEELDVAGMSYDDAMQRILLSHGLEPYLERGSTITITVVGGNDAHGEEMLSKVLCRAYNIAEEENVIYYQVDWETVRAAQAAGLCIPRYLAWQQLLREDPAITAEDVKKIPKEEIHQMVQMDVMENPCGE
ncbi:MAG: hypothetical protein J6C98_00975 [Oscillospiraceae bacterium]|nr:hypothetical protein [Oscillospiraceae bacterium]